MVNEWYPPGETQTTKRLEDEPWYSDYQWLLGVTRKLYKEHNPNKLVVAFNKEYKKIFHGQYPDQERLLRWATFFKNNMKVTQKRMDYMLSLLVGLSERNIKEFKDLFEIVG